jgi:hypothetical protein
MQLSVRIVGGETASLIEEVQRAGRIAEPQPTEAEHADGVRIFGARLAQPRENLGRFAIGSNAVALLAARKGCRGCLADRRRRDGSDGIRRPGARSSAATCYR